MVGERLSYRVINQYVNGLASALRATGVGPGDRPAVLGRNSKDFRQISDEGRPPPSWSALMTDADSED